MYRRYIVGFVLTSGTIRGRSHLKSPAECVRHYKASLVVPRPVSWFMRVLTLSAIGLGVLTILDRNAYIVVHDSLGVSVRISFLTFPDTPRGEFRLRERGRERESELYL